MPPRPFTPKVVTANDLIEGDVIYLTRAGDWTRVLREAELITEAARAEARLALGLSVPETAVGVYLAEAQAGPDGRPAPIHFREGFRATGPSNYAHGKQAEARDV